jgi:hypothetical protein
MQLPFTHDRFLDVFGVYNTSLWPAVAALWVATAWAAVHWLRRGRLSDRVLFLFFTGAEQFFDLAADPGETRDLAGDPSRGADLAAWRDRTARHLAERGGAWAPGRRILTRSRGTVYGPNYPKPAVAPT